MTKVKICGLRTREAVKAAVQAGADFIGFVFAKSKRQVSFEEASALTPYIPAYVRKVGVFVSPTLEELQTAIAQVPLDMVQIHGHYDEKIAEELTVPVIRAIQITGEALEIGTQQDYLLFDAPIAGSGQTFDWEKLDKTQMTLPFFMAGGLNHTNVKEAIHRFKPFAVDVSTGVETDGVKDVQKIKAFVEKVKYDL